MSATAEPRVWEWDVEDWWNPRYDATAAANGLSYGCTIQGPFCGWDAAGSQTWDEFLEAGPPSKIQMPNWIAAQIRAYALARSSDQE